MVGTYSYALRFDSGPAQLTFARPVVAADHEQAILRFLIPLVQPIGDFRRDHVPRSRGKGRGKKSRTKTEQESMPEWMPEVYDHITIGFNTTIRRLESLAVRQKPPTLPQTIDEAPADKPPVELSVMFVCRESLPDIISSSLPLLIATSAPKTRRAKLVDISPQAEARIACALRQPRVGVLGVEEGAPDADALLQFVNETIAEVEVPWLEQGLSPAYYPVNIERVEIGSKKSTARTPKRKRSAEG